MTHKVIGSVVIGLLWLAMLLFGWCYGRKMFNSMPAHKFKWLPLVWPALFAVVSVAQYHLDKFMSDGKASYRRNLFSLTPVYGLFFSAWVSGWRARKHSTQAKEE